jgi:hypothetical protein
MLQVLGRRIIFTPVIQNYVWIHACQDVPGKRDLLDQDLLGFREKQELKGLRAWVLQDQEDLRERRDNLALQDPRGCREFRGLREYRGKQVLMEPPEPEVRLARLDYKE